MYIVLQCNVHCSMNLGKPSDFRLPSPYSQPGVICNSGDNTTTEQYSAKQLFIAANTH